MASVPPEPDCLFCTLFREGDHVAATDGFVAIRDINPQAQTHLLVIPQRNTTSSANSNCLLHRPLQ